jgi:hypothetical protein
MPDTFQAIAVIAVSLLPGALYVWSFEREAGAWGVRLSDRVLRFVGVSALLHVVFAPVTYRLWVDFVRSGRIESGTAPLRLWPLAIAYVLGPLMCGTAVGRATMRQRPWPRVLTGPNPAPRAWDFLFASAPDGWIRMRLKSGVWLAGAFALGLDGGRSYAAGYPEEQDLYLVQTYEVDPDSGEFLSDDEGGVVELDRGILVRWSEVEYLEFIQAR